MATTAEVPIPPTIDDPAILDEIRDAIVEIGFEPRQRNVHYELMDPEHEKMAVEANRKWLADRQVKNVYELV